MGFLQEIGGKVTEHFEKKRLEQEEFERMRRQVEFEDRISQEKKEREDALESTRQAAIKRANEKQGLERLRALNRAERLTDTSSNTLFSKLSQHTQRNMMKRDENMRRTQLLREESRRMRGDQTRKF